MLATVTDKGQVTVPKEIRDRLGIAPGSRLDFEAQEDGTLRALVKRLLRITADHWRVRQYNPPRDFDLPKKKWSRAQMITEKRYG